MNIQNKFSVVALLLTTLYTTSLFAGITTTGDVVPKKSAAKEIILKTNDAAFENASTQLRCWQYGRLLFEEVDFEKEMLKGADKMLTFKQKAKNQNLYLLELGSTTCMYKEN